MKRKGFTLVELLVVIAIIALLMGILMPALAEVKRMAYRVICGTNLRGIGTAMVTYASENDGDFPRAGGKGCTVKNNETLDDNWDVDPSTVNNKTVEEAVFGDTDPRATVTASLYYLVKYASTGPKQFHCKGDSGATVFKMSDFDTDVQELVLLWDFGYKDNDSATPMPGECNSYAYAFPYNHTAWFGSNGSTERSFALHDSLNPASAVAADRNPYADKNARDIYVEEDLEEESKAKWVGNDTQGQLDDPDGQLNSASHNREGQNVLFLDNHVDYERHPNCAIERDNIYQYWKLPSGTKISEVDAKMKQFGDGTFEPKVNHPGFSGGKTMGPRHEKDSFLVSEFNERD
jgi:prepilin-type N-terminal cleavage/methylation domain-containing protein